MDCPCLNMAVSAVDAQIAVPSAFLLAALKRRPQFLARLRKSPGATIDQLLFPGKGRTFEDFDWAAKCLCNRSVASTKSDSLTIL
jgi:hypothetical protein